MPNPQLTWERSLTTTFTAGDPIANVAALASLVAASSDWRVIAGGNGTTDDYVEIGGALAGPNPNARFLIGVNPTGGANQPNQNNKGFEKATGSTNYMWCCYAPDDGRSGVPWTAGGAVYNNRNTGFMFVGQNDAAIDRVRMLSSEEILCVTWGKTSVPTSWWGFIGGAQILPPRDPQDSESDGRVRGLACQPAAIPAAIWNAPIFCSTSAVPAANGKASFFDPAAPTTQLAAVQWMFTTAANPPTVGTHKSAGGGEVHLTIPWCSRVMGTVNVPGSNASPLSSRATDPTGTTIWGGWRQIRQGPDRVDGINVTDPPPPGQAVSYTLGSDATIARDTIYFDDA